MQRARRALRKVRLLQERQLKEASRVGLANPRNHRLALLRQVSRVLRLQESVGGRARGDWRRVHRRPSKPARPRRLLRLLHVPAEKDDDLSAAWLAQVQNSSPAAQRTRRNEADIPVVHRGKAQLPPASLANNLPMEVLLRPSPVRDGPSMGRKKVRKVLRRLAHNNANLI